MPASAWLWQYWHTIWLLPLLNTNQESPMPATVLVVDDQPGLRQMVRFALQLQGFVVIEAEDGVQALELLNRQQVSVLVTDWMMPNMDGLGLIRAVRQASWGETLPIIITSCFNDRTAKQVARETGALTWLKKPFRMGEIQLAVESALSTAPLAEHRATTPLPHEAGLD
ncbi:MAG: hypothetical protein C0614_05225 [Desulfuromonas sp.]|nr:MAG: hypothetical protein C0614_05225 [Desulfuromonas sp.]